MIWRDDDVNVYADIDTLKRIQALFNKYDKVHTVAILMKDLWEGKGVWYWLMTTPNLDIALHGSEHKDYSVMSYDEICYDLLRTFHYWKEHTVQGGYGLRSIRVFYPPWNKVSDNLRRACAEFNLKVNDSVDLAEVYNFHWWEMIDPDNLKKLEEELEKW